MADSAYEPNLPSADAPYSLTDEQRDTARRLSQILGRSVSERYADFCRLAYGPVPLRATIPFAAHALRELNSSFQDSLESLADVKRQASEEEQQQLDAVRKALENLDFSKHAIEQATRAIATRDNYQNAIRKISSWLGLDPDGDVVKAWIKFKDIHKQAHERTFTRSLAVDEAFREEWARPFDMVARAVVVAVQGKYAALMKRVNDLARMTHVGNALSLFQKQIPGAHPLQWHFYTSIEGKDWLPELMRRKLITEPVVWDNEDEARFYGEWPVGQYLNRMAKEGDAETRQRLIVALRGLATSKHPDVRRSGLEIISNLPSGEAATLTDVINGWLTKGSHVATLSATENTVKGLAVAGLSSEALTVAAVLFQVFDKGGEIDSLYSRHMYEHSLPRIAPILTAHCGLETLRLLTDLLHQAAFISKKVGIDPRLDNTSVTSNALSDGEDTPYDIYGALVQAARNSAVKLMEREDADVAAIVEILIFRPYRVFKRLAMHVLARRPEGATSVADNLLLSENNLEESAFRHEYAELATARFPAMRKENQDKLLALVDAMPGKYLDAYEVRIRRIENREPTADDRRTFSDIVIRDATFYWRGVLPSGRQEALARIINEHGEPDAWRNRLDEPDVSPRSAADFAAAPAAETVAYLKMWAPTEQPARQTKAAVAMELRNAVNAAPLKFSSGAAEFRGLPLLYIRRLIEGLRTPAQDGIKIEWLPVLKLILSILPSVQPPKRLENSFEDDDPSGFWAAKEAGELIRIGLTKGRSGIPLDCADLLKSVLAVFEQASPISPEYEQFEERYSEYPYFAAEQTMYGLTVDMFVLFLYWITRHEQSELFSAPREAVARTTEFQAFARRALASTGDNGKIARVVLGRWLTWLYYFGEEWLKVNFDLIFSDDSNMYECAWLGHLLNDRPAKDLTEPLAPYYREEIARLQEATTNEKKEPRANRVSEYLMVLMLWGVVPEDLLNQFEREAPLSIRRHAMWFVVNEMRKSDLPDDIRDRGIVYWNRRLTAAENAQDKEQLRDEVSVASNWTAGSPLDTTWIVEQFLRLLRAGYSLSNSFSIIGWLSGICDEHPDSAVEIDLLITHAKTDRWATTGQEAAVRDVLSAGQSFGTPATLNRIDHIVSVLSSQGEPGFLSFSRLR